MANTFKEYLSEVEQTISFDPENETPEEIAKRAKLASRKAAASPERAIRMRQQNIKDKSTAIKQDEDDQRGAGQASGHDSFRSTDRSAGPRGCSVRHYKHMTRRGWLPVECRNQPGAGQN